MQVTGYSEHAIIYIAGKVGAMKKLIEFLNKLEDSKIFYKLDKVRDAIMVEIAVPGERWEVEFMDDNTVEVERYKSDGNLKDESELEVLFSDFAD